MNSVVPYKRNGTSLKKGKHKGGQDNPQLQQKVQQQTNRPVSLLQWKSEVQTQLNKLEDSNSMMYNLLKQGFDMIEFVIQTAEDIKKITTHNNSDNLSQHNLSEQLENIKLRITNIEQKIGENNIHKVVEHHKETNVHDIEERLNELVKEVRNIQKQIKKPTGPTEHQETNFPSNISEILHSLQNRSFWMYGTVKCNTLVLYRTPSIEFPSELFYKKGQRILIYYNIVKGTMGENYLMTRSDAEASNFYWVKYTEKDPNDYNIKNLSTLP